MSKKDTFDNKNAVSPSRPLNCSTAAVRGNAKRKTPEQRARRAYEKHVHGASVDSRRAILIEEIAREIREAVNLEKEKLLLFCETIGEVSKDATAKAIIKKLIDEFRADCS